MSNDRARHPSGVPIGGQYAQQGRAASDVHLSEDPLGRLVSTTAD